MLELLKFIFSDIWYFLGFIAILTKIGSILISIIEIMK